MNQDFPITSDLLEQIIFAMENQSDVFYLDMRRAVIVPAGACGGNSPSASEGSGETPDLISGDYLPLPPWTPADGYRLMERFVLSLKNPLYREALRECLSSGTGVFRRFKDTLKERPDIERLWFTFKNREMRRYISDWINRQQEGRKAEALGPEPPETEDLILADFTFRFFDESDLPYWREKNRQGFDEGLHREPPEYRDLLFQADGEAWGSLPLTPPLPDDLAALAGRTPEGETAGFIWGSWRERGTFRLALIRGLYVEPEFRGLGLSEALLGRFCRFLWEEKDISRIDCRLPAGVDFLLPALERGGFSLSSQGVSQNRQEWILRQP